MRKLGVIIKTYLVIMIMVLVIVWMILGLGWYIFRFEKPGMVFLIGLIVAMVAAFIIFTISFKKEKNNPISNLHAEFMKEIRENGCTDRFLELAERGLEMCSDSPHDFVFLKDFAMYGAEALMLRNEYDKALEYLNHININEIKKKDMSFLDGGQGLIGFFTVQMELCEESNNVERARNVYNDAIGYIDDFYGKHKDLDMLIDEFYWNYNYLNGDYIQAKRYAENIINNKFHIDSKLISGYLHYARIYNSMGDYAKADEYMDKAAEIIEQSQSVLSKQTYEFQKKRMQENRE